MFKMRTGLTLVEVTIISGILALLAAVIIPGIIRARVSVNDSLAKNTLLIMSNATERYAKDKEEKAFFPYGNYPTMNSLTGATLEDFSVYKFGATFFHHGESSRRKLEGIMPVHLNFDYCGKTIAGFHYQCLNSSTGYSYAAIPVTTGLTGSKVFTAKAGSVFSFDVF